ncbi:hypothetical protein KAJ27_19140 [bacterium]|nr:hypothetical protein [bacterium]
MRLSTKIFLGFAGLYIVFFTLSHLPTSGNGIKRIDFQIYNHQGRIYLNNEISEDDKMSVIMTFYSKSKSNVVPFEVQIPVKSASQFFRYYLPMEMRGNSALKKIKFVLMNDKIELDHRYVSISVPIKEGVNKIQFIDLKKFKSI